MKVLGILFAIMVLVLGNPQLEDSREIFTSAEDIDEEESNVEPLYSSELDNNIDQETDDYGEHSGKEYLRGFEILKHRTDKYALRMNETEELNPEDYVGPKVRTWTAKEIFDTIRFNPNHKLIPYIRGAASQILLSVFTDQNWKNVLAAVPSPSGKKNWRLDELEMYSLVPKIDEEFRAALDHAHQLLIDIQTTHPEAQIQRIPVVVAALDISTWNILAVKYGLLEPDISPYLQAKLEEILEDLTSRGASEEEEITLVTTVGVIENNPEYYELNIPPKLLAILEAEEKILPLDQSSSEEEIVDIGPPLIIPFEPIPETAGSDNNLQPPDEMDERQPDDNTPDADQSSPSPADEIENNSGSDTVTTDVTSNSEEVENSPDDSPTSPNSKSDTANSELTSNSEETENNSLDDLESDDPPTPSPTPKSKGKYDNIKNSQGWNNRPNRPRTIHESI